MKLRTLALLTVGLLGSTVAANAAPTTYDGITFPAGDVSFADELISLTFGSPAPTDPNYLDGNDALGAPDYVGAVGSVSLGRGGFLVVKFTDNSLTGSNSADADLHIFEVGPDIEDTYVWISINGIDFISVGTAGGSTTSIDIDPYLVLEGLDPFTQFAYVMLQDVPELDGQSGSTVGADIDAIGAISSGRPIDPDPRDVPAPGALGLLGLGLVGAGLMRRRKRG